MALTYEFRANFNDLSPNYCPPINMKDSVKSFMKNIFNEGLAYERFPSPNPSYPGGEPVYLLKFSKNKEDEKI